MKWDTDKTYRHLIGSRAWRRLRARKIANDPLCEHCLGRGIAVPATEVHHVVPIGRARTAGEARRLALSYGNLVSLCHDCHAAAHKELAALKDDDGAHRATERFIERFFGFG